MPDSSHGPCSCSIGVLCDEATRLRRVARLLWERYTAGADKRLLEEWRRANAAYHNHLAAAQHAKEMSK